MSNENTPMPHPHAELIKAWADGAKIQCKIQGKWTDWKHDQSPAWWDNMEYRIKPEEAEDYHIADDSKKDNEWIKFDPNDPETFPPHASRVLAATLPFKVSIRYFFTGSERDSNWKCHVKYWRPLPKPPQEEQK